MSNFLYNDISEQLEEKIHDMPVGAKLPSERTMAEEFGVSRNVLREALRVLSEKGIIEIHSGRGAFVADKQNEKLVSQLESILFENVNSLSDIEEVREAVELAVFEKAVERATDEDIQILEEIYGELELSKENPKKYNSADIRFHIQVANSTHNSVFPVLISALYNLTDKKLFRITELYPTRVNSGQREHRAIIDAIKKRDVNAARAVGQKHFNIKDILEGRIHKF